MKRFYRILSSKERELIVRDQCIKPSIKDWVIYPPGTVVFLFDLGKTDPCHLTKIPKLHHDEYGDTWILEFDGNISTVPDESQKGWPGAVVFHGTILFSNISNITWKHFDQ